KGRLFLADSENPGRIWYSHKFERGLPTRFSDVLYMDIDGGGDEPKAIGSIGEKLLVFYTSHCFYTYGDGPNVQAQLGEFAPFQRVVSGVGCKDPKSVIE